MTDSSQDRAAADQKRDPLISIGFIVLALMLVPIFLYSMVPEGPVKEGDLVFATARHRVPLIDPARYREMGDQAFCVLEPREQLLVLRILPGASERSLVARPITTVRRGVPFCPPKAEVLLQTHQANLKIDIWAAIEDGVTNAFSRWQ